MITRLVIIFSLLSMLCSLSAQDIVINSRSLTVSDGMVGRNVRSITEDLKSKIWIATDLGVTVFDGLELAKPKQLPEEIDNVSFDRIFCTKDGLLWFWTLGFPNDIGHRKVLDYQIYDPVENKMINLFEPSDKKVELILAGENSNIWIFTNEGERYSYADDLILEKPVASKNLFQILVKGDSHFMLYGDRLEEYQNNSLVKQIPLEYPSDRIFYSDNGNIYLINNFTFFNRKFTPPFLGKYNLQSNELIYCDYSGRGADLRANSFQVFVTEYNQNLALITAGELITVDPEQLTILDRQEFHKWDRRPITVNDCYVSSQGKYWLALNEGLLLAELSDRMVRNYFAEESYSIRGMDKWSADSLLVATYSGSFLLNKNDDKVRELTSPLFYGIVEFNGNRSLIGTHTREYLTLNKKTQELRRKPFEGVDYPYLAYLPQALDNGEYWFGTSGGAFRYDPSRDNFFKPATITNTPLDRLTIRSISWIKERYFFCTENGMYVAGKDLVPAYVSSLGEAVITDIVADSNHYWVSTFGEGLKQINAQFEVIANYNTASIGFSNDFIYSIHDDGFGYLWLPTNNGLIRFEKRTNKFETFFPNDGFANYEYNNGSSFVDKDGNIYLGGTDGLSKINPADFVEKKRDVQFDITRLGYSNPDGEQVLIDFDASDNAVELPSNYLTFSLSISAKNFAIEEKIKYKYQIPNYSDGWIPIENNKLSLSRLPFGDHTLEIKPFVTGHRRAGLINIPISVAAPFYFQPIFILSVLCGLALLTFLYIRWRTNQLRLRNILLSKQVQDRTQELSNRNDQLLEINDTRDRLFGIIAHDLRGPLIGFKDLDKKIKFLNTKKRQADLELLTTTVQENYENLTSLLDNLLHWISIQRGRLPIKIEKISLDKHIDDTLSLYDHSINQKEIQIIREGPALQLMADQDALEILLRNLLNNAIKYSHPKGKIWIASFENESEASFVVEDEGVGMTELELQNLFLVKAQRGRQGTRGEKSTGLGLPLCKDFVELMNGRIEVKSELKKGTRFVVSLPKFRTLHPKKSNTIT